MGNAFICFGYASTRDDLDQVVVQLGGEGHNIPGQFYFDDFELLGGSITINFIPENGSINVPVTHFSYNSIFCTSGNG